MCVCVYVRSFEYTHRRHEICEINERVISNERKVYSYQKILFPNVSDNVVLLLDFRKGYSEEVVQRQTQEDKQLKI